MPTTLVYRCNPCNFEYEHLSFGTKWDKEVPPCPVCKASLTHDEEPEVGEYKTYRCSCSAEIEKKVPLLWKLVPKTMGCPHCGKTAFLELEAPNIGHSNSAKASVDVIIGKDAEKKWERIYDRKSNRDKIRQESDTQALKAVGRNDYQPIKGGQLKSVVVPNSTVNNDE